ncbi:MAG TPA: hypothetical protein VG474_04430 [Solirubrobacteraceae bacterium]|nr:hypothetical protein [Solirubrobacteraceae bacterium]
MPPGADDRSPPARLRTGLRTSVVNNSSAFAFSIMITGSFGLLSRSEGPATTGEVFAFGMLAVAGFVTLEALASNAFKRRPETYPVEVTMLGTAFSFLSVAAGYGGAIVGTALLDDTLAWLLGAFCASALFVLVEAVELAVVEPFEERWVTENIEEDPDS